LEFTSTLKKNYEFRRLYSKGKSCANTYLVVYSRKTRSGRSRIGYTVSNKVGHAVVRQTFKASGVGTIAGSYVLDGKITRGSKARITREGEQIFEGPLASLKRFKDDVKEVNAGYECGLVFEGFNDLKEDDMIEIYIMVEVPR